jgi:hypothetical protein
MDLEEPERRLNLGTFAQIEDSSLTCPRVRVHELNEHLPGTSGVNMTHAPIHDDARATSIFCLGMLEKLY